MIHITRPITVATFFLIYSTLAFGYTISPKADIHEAITRAAKICFDQSDENSKPTSCENELYTASDVDMTWIHDSSISFLDFSAWYRRARGYSAKYPDLEEAVRWPDDPTRQIGLRGIAKFSVNMLTTCNQFLNDNPNGRNDINDGLLCNSHNGDMQFLHSQASSIGEPPEDTYKKISDWGMFLYKVASRHLSDQELDQEYCSYFSGDDLFSKALLPNSTAIPCENVKDPKWKLTTLFTLKCPNPLSSTGCYEEIGPSRFDKARINATGALLHLIQDSYSQSHVERGSCEVKNNRVTAKVECLPITRFTTYRGQVKHSDADRTPIFGEECNSTGISPTLASAIMLWNIDQKRPLDEFKSDFERIFGTEQYIAESVSTSSLGQCFGG
ncbi:hypothetical protein [Microbulbifer hydrolyticus]|uniref:Uncharacterized protein n=1 Tax=Microbulbifer hydrolyticus TaxID=48074 RepID=A0A6P1TBJ2_9GAMM|nr:hypothetical protein [Microbulbifer hydrolyticus]MBB5210520.1 hypothetical protein [Microbulbifer hydrolyticus]QHQ39006.1 hypothetical protein GTQ55_08420 [Microbulbifer hydrolyticus]